MSRHGAFRQGMETLAASAVAGAMRLLPRAAALRFGRGLGRAWGGFDARHVAIAVDNLRHAFPDWDEARLRATAFAVYEHFGQALLDILWLSGRAREAVLPLVEVVGGEHVEAAMRGGRGLILVTAHIGNWEMHGVAHGLTFGPIGVVARPLDNAALDAKLCAFRAVAGNTIIYKRKALAQVLRMLKEKRAVAILIDQNVAASDGIFVDFFGRPAATTTVAAAIAVKTGCALVQVRSELRPDGRYRFVYEPPLEWTPSGDRDEDIRLLTQRLTHVIERWVTETPGQWLWLHRRWKTRPPA